MTPAQRYRKGLEVTLTSGDVIQVRPLNKSDWIFVGDFPSTLASGEADRVFRAGNESAKRKLIEHDLPFWERVVKCAVTRCVTTEGFKVVDKPPVECGSDEVAFEELSQLDQTAISTVVLRASGLIGREAAQEAKTFPEKQEASDGVGHGRDSIRDASEPAP